MKATVLGPVEVVDEPLSVLDDRLVGLCVTCGRVAAVFRIAGESFGVVDETTPRRSGFQSVSTPMCTGSACDSRCSGDRSFLKNFSVWSALGALTDARRQFLDVIEHLTSLRHLVADLLLGIHDRGVVAAERLADLGQ